MMTLKEINQLGQMIVAFLAMFRMCFKSRAGWWLLHVYVRGQLSDVQRKNCEAIALLFGECPRTLQRLLESIKWDEELLRDRCQQIVAKDHSHPEAIGLIDESGIHKSGRATAGVGRQYNGNRGKTDNCLVAVHLGYSAPGFRVLLDSRVYLPQDWADDPQRRKQNYIPDEIRFQTKPQIALALVDRALANGIRVVSWTCDELYGRDSAFLDGLQARNQRFVAEIPCNTRVWTAKPTVITSVEHEHPGRPQKTPCVAPGQDPCEVRNLLKYSSKRNWQSWQNFRIKDTCKGPEVWKIKHLTVWRQTHEHLPSTRHTLLIARNVRTGETKYFLANGVIGEAGVTVRGLLRVAFGRWAIEAELRVSKEELGMDHFEVRGWRCIHRHYYVTGLSMLLCNRIRQSLDRNHTGELTVEQVRRAINSWLQNRDLPPDLRDEQLQRELDRQQYYQRRNAQACRSHTKTRIAQYQSQGIDVAKIKSCIQLE